MPNIKDADLYDKITLTCNMGFAANFVFLEGKDYISILDISKAGTTPIRAGMFILTFQIDDGRNVVNFPFALFVIDPDELSSDSSPDYKYVVNGTANITSEQD